WIVTETLTKDPAERTQTARELMKRLQRVKQRVDADAEVERSVAPERLSAAGSSATGPAIAQHSISPATQSQEATRSQTGEWVAPPTHLSSAEYVVSQIKSHRKAFALTAIIALVVLSGIVFALYKVITRPSNQILSLETAKFTRLTTTGNATGAVISP